jgi:hypothetical protein
VTSQDPLADRYGRPRPWRQRAIVAACVAVGALFLGWLAWSAWSHATPDVQSDLVSFDVVDEHTATAVVEVRFADDDVVRASCTLEAYAEDHTLVGTASFAADPGHGGRYEETLRTERRATSVTLVGCLAPGQTQPR